jgi:hypothetical protein
MVTIVPTGLLFDVRLRIATVLAIIAVCKFYEPDKVL